MTRFHPLLAVVATATLASCGGSASGSSGVASLGTTTAAPVATGAAADSATSSPDDVATGDTVPADPEEASLAFARCMREHGIDMPDPQAQGGGGVVIAGTFEEIDGEKMAAADAECKHFLEAAGANFQPPSGEELEKMKTEMLAFAKCMREHGFDMPDPQIGDGGMISITVGGPGDGGGAAPVDQEAFSEANKECGSTFGGGVSVGIGATPAESQG